MKNLFVLAGAAWLLGCGGGGGNAGNPPMPGDPHWAPPLAGGATFLSYAGRDPGTLRVP